MKKILFILIAVLFAASYASARGNYEEIHAEMAMIKTDNSEGSADSMKADNSSEGGDTMMMMAADTNVHKSPFDLTGLTPAVIPFSGEDNAKALAENKTVIYYFAANWCPTCKAAYASIKKDYKKIPSDTVIVVVNYDTESALKSKYGVSYQHTYVTIDSSGAKQKIWSGSSTVDDILSQAESM